jgi:hypothetical protein
MREKDPPRGNEDFAHVRETIVYLLACKLYVARPGWIRLKDGEWAPRIPTRCAVDRLLVRPG